MNHYARFRSLAYSANLDSRAHDLASLEIDQLIDEVSREHSRETSLH